MPFIPFIPLIAAGVGAGATIYSANRASNAAGRAADVQQTAVTQSNDLQRSIYDQTRADLSPFTSAGVGALGALQSRMGLPTGGGYSTAPTSAPRTVDPAYLQNNPDLAAEGSKQVANGTFPDMQSYLQWHTANYPHEGRSEFLTPEQTQAAGPAAGPQTPFTAPTGPAAGVFGNTANPSYTAPNPFQYGAAEHRESPGYQFQMSEGQRALDNSASARGGLQSGGATKATLRYSQGLADQDFSANRAFAYGQYADNRNFDRSIYQDDRNYLTNQFNQQTGNYFDLARLGQSSAAGVGNAGANYAGQVGNNLMAGAGAAAQGYANQSGIQTGMVGNLAGQATNLIGQYGSRPTGATSSGSTSFVPTPVTMPTITPLNYRGGF